MHVLVLSASHLAIQKFQSAKQQQDGVELVYEAVTTWYLQLLPDRATADDVAGF
jgi:hypothetical protein